VLKCSTVTPYLVQYVATFGLLFARKSISVNKFEEYIVRGLFGPNI